MFKFKSVTSRKACLCFFFKHEQWQTRRSFCHAYDKQVR